MEKNTNVIMTFSKTKPSPISEDKDDIFIDDIQMNVRTSGRNSRIVTSAFKMNVESIGKGETPYNSQPQKDAQP